jgi:hypothetical protein
MTHQQALTTLASERYLLGEMSEIERYAFEEHYFDCEICAEDVRVAAVMRDGVRDGLLGSRVTAPADGTTRTAVRTRTSTWRDTIVPWAAAASLALIVGYQQFARPSAGSIEPQALTPVTLRAATRGADPIVRVGPTGLVTLAIDIADRNVAGSAAELAYALRNPAGEQVGSGRLPAPAAGAPLLLLVPASTLSATGRYVLSVRDATSSEGAATEYAFAVTTP